MSDASHPPPASPPRRAFLRALALAPVAAGCATAHPLARSTRAAAAPAAASASGAATPAAPAPAEDPLAPLRALPLAMDAEPAFVFRAAVERPQE